MIAFAVGPILAVAILAFVGIASIVLLWDGLAVTVRPERGGASRVRARSRAEIVAGALGFAIVLWIALGFLRHAS